MRCSLQDMDLKIISRSKSYRKELWRAYTPSLLFGTAKILNHQTQPSKTDIQTRLKCKILLSAMSQLQDSPSDQIVHLVWTLVIHRSKTAVRQFWGAQCSHDCPAVKAGHKLTIQCITQAFCPLKTPPIWKLNWAKHRERERTNCE